MLSMLSDIEKAIVETIRMRLTTQQALEYLKDNEFPVSRATYFRHKRIVEEKKLERVYQIAIQYNLKYTYLLYKIGLLFLHRYRCYSRRARFYQCSNTSYCIVNNNSKMSYSRRLENVLQQIEYIDNKINKDLINQFSKYLVTKDTSANYQHNFHQN